MLEFIKKKLFKNFHGVKLNMLTLGVDDKDITDTIL
jgi:hypothetical protein